MRWLQYLLSCVLIVSLSLIALSITGCVPPEDPILDLIDTDLKKTKVDDLGRTMGFISSQRRYEMKEFESKISTGLNRWVTYSSDKIAETQWTLDPAVQPLMDQYEGLAVLERTDDFSFINTDAYFIQEASWVSQILKRVTSSTQLNVFELFRLAADDFKPSSDSQDPVVDIVKRLNPDCKSAKDLAASLKYFDWINRNIQLSPDVDQETQEVDEVRLNDNEDLAAAGVPGTGYRQYPWQTLLYARGDYVERAKLFMIGLQQMGLDSVMLATAGDSDSDSPHPWAVAVIIGDQYYLFDTKLALPIPGETIGSIATLTEVRDNPDLLKSLDLTVDESLEENTKYWVRPNQLEKLKGLIYVAPEAISKRIQGLESHLIGDDRLPLVSSPTKEMAELPKTDGVEFQVWDIAFKTHQFRQAVREALEKSDDDALMGRLMWHFMDEAYIDGFTRYRTARARFFGGRFESARNVPGLNAIESFEHLTYTDATIDSLAGDKNLQRGLGILKSQDQNVKDFQREVVSVQQQMRLVRRDTRLFLAQSHFDNSSVVAAANWLKLLKEKEDADRWSDAINYLLARSYEASKEYDLALAIYQEDKKSIQAHGNLIRVRILKQLIAKLEAAGS